MTPSTTDREHGSVHGGTVHCRRAGKVGYIRLDRPRKSNSYTRAMLGELGRCLDEMEGDPAVRVVVIQGTGNRAFCAGADRVEISRSDYRHALNLFSARMFSRIAEAPFVTLAAINGAAVGGGLELALACDLRIASENAFFAFPEPSLGLIPAAGGTHRLPKTVGITRAKELILGGVTWQASDALAYGLINQVVSAEKLEMEVERWVERICRLDPLALRLAKKALNASSRFVEGQDLETVIQALLYHLRWERFNNKTGDSP
ncbi:MAG: enoyl-CoA hydratase/isomerase family protein [Thermodesulfobacteriota bacterium]